MFAFRIDPTGAYDLSISCDPDALVTLARAYVAHEQSLSEAERMAAPPLELIQDLASRLEDSLAGAGEGEATRATASGDFDQRLEQAMKSGGLAIERLKGMYAENPGQLEHWGVSTKKTPAGKITVSRPANVGGWVAFLEAYVAKESTLPAAQQVANPPLEQMRELQAELSAAFGSRGQGYNQRLVSNSAKVALALELQDTLELAAANLIVLKFGRKVVRELLSWGFAVTERSSASRKSASSEASSESGTSGAGSQSSASSGAEAAGAGDSASP